MACRSVVRLAGRWSRVAARQRAYGGACQALPASERFDREQSIESASTPPSSWYTSADVLALEKRTVFASNWLFAGRADQVRNEGDFFTGNVLGEPFVVVRNSQGTLSAFYNVCQHHAAEVAQGEGTCSQFRCPYHGWTYALDGRLTGAKRLAGIKQFRASQVTLTPMEVRQLGHLVFIRLSHTAKHRHLPAASAAPGVSSDGVHSNYWKLEEELQPLEHYLNEMHTQRLRFLVRRTYDMQCNWKVFVDNYCDGGYHVSVLHPDLSSSLDLASYRIELQKYFSIQWCAGGVAADSQAPVDSRVGTKALYAFVYPNLMINRYGPWMDINYVIPTSATTSKVIFDYFYDGDPKEKQHEIEDSLKKSDQVQQEDGFICESVQRGLSSAGYDRGRYAPKVETPMYHFHSLLSVDLDRYTQ